MSDDDDDDDDDIDIDWVEKWEKESVAPATSGIQEFNEELCLKTVTGGCDEFIDADDSTIKKMKVREDLMMLPKGKYNLEGLKEAIKPKPTPVKQLPVVKSSESTGEA